MIDSHSYSSCMHVICSLQICCVTRKCVFENNRKRNENGGNSTEADTWRPTLGRVIET